MRGFFAFHGLGFNAQEFPLEKFGIEVNLKQATFW